MYTYIYIYTHNKGRESCFVARNKLFTFNHHSAIGCRSHVFVELPTNKRGFSQCTHESWTSMGETKIYHQYITIPWEPTSFIFRGYNPYTGDLKPSDFMVLGSKGTYIYIYRWCLNLILVVCLSCHFGSIYIYIFFLRGRFVVTSMSWQFVVFSQTHLFRMNPLEISKSKNSRSRT